MALLPLAMAQCFYPAALQIKRVRAFTGMNAGGGIKRDIRTNIV